MRSAARIQTVTLAAALVSGVVAGCAEEQFSFNVLNPLNLQVPFLPHKKPIRVGIAQHQQGVFDPANWRLSDVGMPSTPLRRKLEAKIGEPVHIEYLTPFQVAAHLQTGRLQFGLLGVEDCAALRDDFGSLEDLGTVIAMSQTMVRRGVIVVRADSSVTDFSALRGQRFAFGPSGDPVLDTGAKAALEAAGVSPNELRKEIIPVPGTFQHHVSSNEAAFEVAYGLGTVAGVIDKADYDALPEEGGSLVLRRVGKNQFRILGETKPHRVDTISEGPFIASQNTDPKLAEKVTAFLLEAGTKYRGELAQMGLAGFTLPPADAPAVPDPMKSAEPTTVGMMVDDS